MSVGSTVVVALVACALASGCKGEAPVGDDPRLRKDLGDCRKASDDQKSYIAVLESDLAACKKRLEEASDKLAKLEQLGARTPPKPAKAGDVRGNADDAKLYDAFVAALQRSRGAIQNCYQAALKKDAALQGRTVTLDIKVDYVTSGEVSRASFAPRLSDGFDRCMEAVARHWKLPAMPRAVTFAYKQSLTSE